MTPAEPDKTLNRAARRLSSPTGRRWLYGLLMAVVPLLTFYGALSDQEAALWLGMAAAVLGLSTAIANVPPPEHEKAGTPPDGTGRHRAAPEAPAHGLREAGPDPVATDGARARPDGDREPQGVRDAP